MSSFIEEKFRSQNCHIARSMDNFCIVMEAKGDTTTPIKVFSSTFDLLNKMGIKEWRGRAFTRGNPKRRRRDNKAQNQFKM